MQTEKAPPARGKWRMHAARSNCREREKAMYELIREYLLAKRALAEE
jgi:hypothetical protein